MRHYKKIQQPLVVIEDVTCDLCGQCFYNHEAEEFIGATIEFQAGYYWKKFPDMEAHRIDLCEECLYDLVQKCPRQTKQEE
jgi:ferredoxin